MSLIIVFGIGTLLATPFPLWLASILLPSRYHTDVKDVGPGATEAAT